MADFQVKVRNLETGETLVASMADCDECLAWLTERPPFIEILGVLADVSPADSRRLKEAMRPYNKAELELKRRYDEEREKALQQRYQEEMALIESEQRDSDSTVDESDPDRPMSIRFEVDEGLRNVDDKREITKEARDAVEAWVRERNGWVEAKGQMIGEAHLEVWPGKLPEGEENRVREGGRFFARLKPEN